MNVLSLAPDNFDSTVARSATLVIEFSDSLEDFAARSIEVVDVPPVEWGHVDLRSEPSLAVTFGVKTDAALLVFREQVVLYLEEGKHDPARMGELIRRIMALDMLAIKAEIAAQKEAEVALHARRTCPTAQRGPIAT